MNLRGDFRRNLCLDDDEPVQEVAGLLWRHRFGRDLPGAANPDHGSGRHSALYRVGGFELVHGRKQLASGTSLY